MDALDPLGDLAMERFGVPYLYPLQRLVAANVLDAKDHEDGFRQLALLPTGFGKSLCFQLPALLLPGPTVAVYPLLALMEDQRRRLEEVGMKAAVFKGGMEEAARKEAEAAVEAGRAKLVVTNPESLKGRLLDFLKAAKPSHLAIDEAHCVAEWGQTFRPSYLELGAAAEALNPPAMSAFTATASPPILEAIGKSLFGQRSFSLIQGNPDRPNISYSVIRTLARERTLERLLRREARPAIVFVSSREGAQILAESLRARLHSEDLRFYHAGLTKEEKAQVEAWFFASPSGVLISTCAYGMGLDKKNIRTVVHFEAPPSVESYIQEAGRAGRDGQPSKAILLAGGQERQRGEEDEVRRNRREALAAYASARGSCRRKALLGLLGSELSTPCTGCDVCDGREEVLAEGERELGAFARANPRRFEKPEALRLLQGQGGEPPCCGYSGSLKAWRKEDILEALYLAEGRGLLGFRKKWPWKGRLEAGPPTPLPPGPRSR